MVRDAVAARLIAAVRAVFNAQDMTYIEAEFVLTVLLLEVLLQHNDLDATATATHLDRLLGYHVDRLRSGTYLTHGETRH